MPSEDVWLSGVFGGKSVGLECITGQSERSRDDFRHFRASFEDLLLHVILDVSHVQRITDFLVMRYINVRFTFTYLLTYRPKVTVVCLTYKESKEVTSDSTGNCRFQQPAVV